MGGEARPRGQGTSNPGPIARTPPDTHAMNMKWCRQMQALQVQALPEVVLRTPKRESAPTRSETQAKDMRWNLTNTSHASVRAVNRRIKNTHVKGCLNRYDSANLGKKSVTTKNQRGPMLDITCKVTS